MAQKLRQNTTTISSVCRTRSAGTFHRQKYRRFLWQGGHFCQALFTTLEQMMEAELTAQLGYDRYAVSGRNSGNSRNGKRTRNLRTSSGDVTVAVPRDRNSDYHPTLLEKYQTSTNELEDKIIALYAKGVSTRDIQDTLHELYGVEVSPRPSPPSQTRSGDWSKPGRIARLRRSTRSSTWMPFISRYGVMVVS